MNYSATKDIIQGFEDDFITIAEEFPSTSPELRLPDFFKFWDSHYMDCLFANRFDPRELLEAIIEMNKMLVEIITNFSNSHHNRIVALYLLFCLHVKQPKRLHRKIRMTCQDAIIIENLVSENLNQPHCRDASFIWRQLRLRDAIDFVEDRIIYGPSMLNNLKKIYTNNNDQQIAISDYKNDAMIHLDLKLEPLITEIEDAYSTYARIKESLGLNNCSDSTVELQSNGSLNEFIEQARKLVNEFRSLKE